MKWEKTEERGVQCKARASKSKMKADRECEGGVKVSMHVGIGAQDLAESVSTELRDMQSNMVPDPTSLLLPEETMAELMSYDDTLSSGLDVFGGEECSEEGNKTCQKELQFGGYFKLFWGCNVTLSKEGRNMRKDVTCGGKSYEGLGKKEDMLAVGLTGSDEYYDYNGDWVEVGMTVGKGVKCKTNKTSKECEGGVKKDVRVRLGAEDLAQDISTEIRHMHANSVISAPKSLLIPDETIQELRSWDDDATVVTDLDFVDGVECDKKVEFGGYANLFWGCTITFSKKGNHLSKELGCGFKGSQRMGKKDESEYEDQETKKKQQL
mmetsp:Transcript_13993/g.15714  ORF Transcript_13993/g.15714 Transcript_13993/m.15714 type:complete len:323 (-) Transcript_13993:204-1172(-)